MDFVPEKIAFRSFIGQKFSGHALVSFLAQRFTYFDENGWREKIASQDVRLNGVIVNPDTPLSEGDEVEYFAMTRPEPKVPTSIPVLFEDEDLLIVNKPAHLPVHPGGRYLRNTLIHLLKSQRKNALITLAHRLDRETSGCCVLTKSHLGKDKMYWAFFNGDIEKTYWALVWGRPQPPSGMVNEAIGGAMAPGSRVKSRIRIKQAVGGGESKTAKTKYHTLSTKWILSPKWEPPEWPALTESLKKAPSEGAYPISLVECRPLTGRTNQIRVHMAHLGAGLVGDKLYDPNEEIFMKFKDAGPMLEQGKREKSFQRLPPELMRRLVLDAHALHAKSLEFRHPRSGKKIYVEAPAPLSWQGLYEKPKGR